MTVEAGYVELLVAHMRYEDELEPDPELSPADAIRLGV